MSIYPPYDYAGRMPALPEEGFHVCADIGGTGDGVVCGVFIVSKWHDSYFSSIGYVIMAR